MPFEDLALQPFREPRGFIKILQWLFAICAFATCANFTTRFGFDLKCNPGAEKEVANVFLQVQYPFALDQETFPLPKNCSDNRTEIEFLGNGESDASYFVGVGVITFLYAMVAIAIYLKFDKEYQTNNKLPLVDFGMTVLLAILWISSFAAFWHTIGTLSDASDAKMVAMHNKVADKASAYFYPSYSKLYVSMLFGMINFVLWAGNLWFLYKETTWFEAIIKNSMSSQPNQNI